MYQGTLATPYDRGVYIMLKRILFAAVLASVAAVPAEAVILSFTSELTYNAAVGAELFFIDFDSQPQGTFTDGIFAGMVDFGSPEASNPAQVWMNSLAMSDAGSTVASNSVGPIDGIFASPVFAFGLEFSSSGSPQTLELYDGSSALIGTAVSNAGGFFGVLSDASISSFIIRNGEFSPGNNDRFFVDNFRANAAAPVPEPGTLALFGFGLAAGASRLRRRFGKQS